MNKKTIWKAILIAVAAAATALCTAFGLTSCTVTRRTTVESTYYQKGDTTTQITTKTIETYDATKKNY